MKIETYYLAQNKKIEHDFFMFCVINHEWIALDSNGQVINSFYELSKDYKITYLDTIYPEVNEEIQEIKEVQVTEFFGGYDNVVLFVAIVLFIYISIEIYI
ncbi:hypothetical protein UFOVP53_187 [uncultured Caudovirales phage]|uniref:Uncharacterized protein n=1 Tax=uncultured Caudovirales phage TaxID=2100421 RepID=A0A6J5KWM7_9CAUD|nr:hypothetical protein UFOVP53_187 [uncultured Caudovirales phage]